MARISPVLFVHGGAGSMPPAPHRLRSIRVKIRRILQKAYPVLCQKGALEGVVKAIEMFENDPSFNAGFGSRLQQDGKARLSSAVMDGSRGRFGAVINLQRIKHPVLVARLLLEEEDRVLSDEGAFLYACEHDFRIQDPRTPRAIRQWKNKIRSGFGTVGACGLDAEGNLASATSTGGKGFERPGRVSDSAMPVSTYADDFCALSSSGIGEEIIEEGPALKIATRIRDGSSLKKAFFRTFREVRRSGRRMGCIGVDRKGNCAWFTTTDILYWGWQKSHASRLF